MRFTKTFITITAALTLAGGCTPEQYSASADRQVERILADRKQGVLDYQPDTDLDPIPTHIASPCRDAYEPIPVTRLPPPASPPLEPIDESLPWSILGPEQPLLPDLESVGRESDIFGLEAELDREAARYRHGPPAPGDPIRQLDLFSALEYAIQHSRAYQSRLEDLYLATLDVTLERHLFTPRPFAQTNVGFTGGRNDDVNYRSALAVTQSIGVRQQLPYGGEIVAEGLVDFVSALSGEIESGESAEVAIRGAIPLLRGAGWVNLEPLIQSERSLIYEIRDFESFRRDLLVNIASRYFNLLNSQQGLANRRYNYANLLELTRRTQALYEAGRIRFLEVQRSTQALLRAERLMVSAQDSYRTRLDEFKLLIGMPIEEELEIVPVSLDVKVPQLPLTEVIELARRYRLDLQTARDRIEDAQRSVQIASNGLLPDVDLTGGVALRNPSGTPARRLDDRTMAYSAGVSIDWPLDRLSERNAYRRALIFLQRAQRSYEETQERISIDARDALREIRSAELRLRIAAAGIDLAQRRLDYANELLRQGDSDARNVVEAQQSLLEAQDDYEEAEASLQISVLQFLVRTGTLRIDPTAGEIGRALNPTIE